ncbi:hypothetical protein AN958_07592 [Leucoagaricus sp. SymC.cos]|nr:hypothetical protein AN958_07592 [Leucoagaricus sp. SymC.cos]
MSMMWSRPSRTHSSVGGRIGIVAANEKIDMAPQTTSLESPKLHNIWEVMLRLMIPEAP